MATNFLAEFLKRFTGSVRTLPTQTSDLEGNDSGQQIPLLVDELVGLGDFVRNDPEDTIFEEFDSPFPPETRLEWKSRRPSVLNSVIRSAWAVMQLMFCGSSIGAFAVGLFHVDINTLDACHWVSADALDRTQLRIQVVGQVLQGFLLDFWQFLILWTMFKWPLLKELNLLTITLLVAFIDVTYRVFLHLFDAYRTPWIPYPGNVLFGSVTLYSSYAVGRKILATRKLEAFKLAVKLCVQFLFGMLIGYFFNYFAFLWFAQTQGGFKRAVFAFMAPMIIVPGQVVSRLCAIHLEGINHPGTSHAIVAAMYGAASIVFRTLQAGIESFKLFVLLSFAHGVVHLAERLTVPLRDYYWNKLALPLCCCCCCRCCHRRQQYNVRSPRSQRLTADMTIQGMLFETTSIFYSISVLYVYYVAYGMSDKKWSVFSTEITKQIPTALALEVVFNSMIVVFQTRYMNIPVLRVWKRNWKKHLALAMITTTMTVIYFTEYELQLIRAKWLRANETLPPVGNCTGPFH